MEDMNFTNQEKKSMSVSTAIEVLCEEYYLNEEEFKKMVEALSNMVNNPIARNEE